MQKASLMVPETPSYLGKVVRSVTQTHPRQVSLNGACM